MLRELFRRFVGQPKQEPAAQVNTAADDAKHRVNVGDLVSTTSSWWSFYSQLSNDGQRLDGDYLVLPSDTAVMVLEVRPHGSPHLCDFLSHMRVFVPKHGEFWTSTQGVTTIT